MSARDLLGFIGNMRLLKAEEQMAAIQAGGFLGMKEETRQKILHDLRSSIHGEDEADRTLDSERHMAYHRQLEEEAKHGL